MGGLTPFQTLGPFFDFGLVIRDGEIVCQSAATGRHVAIEGTIRDGAGDLLPDALVEIWQANAAGSTAIPTMHRIVRSIPRFDGFGRVATDGNGRFAFRTIVPGRVPGPADTLQAPHLAIGVLARGVLTRLVTRMYFEDEAVERRRSDSCARTRVETHDFDRQTHRLRITTGSTSFCKATAKRFSSTSERS